MITRRSKPGKGSSEPKARAGISRELIFKEDYFKDLIRAMPQPAWIGQADGRPQHFNQAWFEYTGLTEAQSRETGLGTTLHPDDLTRYEERWAEAVNTGIPIDVECRLKQKADAIYQWHRIRGLPLRRPNGQIGNWLATCIEAPEISEQKAAQDQMRANEAKFRSLVEAAPDAFVISNEAGQIRLVNAQTERLFGYSRNELIDKPVEVLLPERFRQQHAIHRQQYLTKPEARFMGASIELFGLKADGSEFPVEISLSAVQTKEGVHICGAVRDIGERKRAQEALRRTAAEVARSHAELEQFAYAASHDLQEPLRTIVGATQVLARDYKDKLDAEANEWMVFAAEGAKRMQVLLNALLDYTRVGAPHRPFELVDCQTVYQAALENLKSAIEESGAEVTSGPLPLVMGDGIQLVQLFQNLLANAIKFEGQRRPRIHVSAEQREQEWRITVRDNGIGIDPKNFRRLFILFQRFHTSEKYPGTGIGLAICKKIVERHGGRIGVESVPGEGSIFYFTLPRVESQSLPAAPFVMYPKDAT